MPTTSRSAPPASSTRTSAASSTAPSRCWCETPPANSCCSGAIPAKYHSGGLWTNACCSHPLPGESTADAARRRLAQEMGFACPLEPLFVFDYNAPVPGGLIENELVHVFGGPHDGPIKPDPAEVSEWKWIRFDDLATDMRAQPEPTRSGSGNMSTSPRRPDRSAGCRRD